MDASKKEIWLTHGYREVIENGFSGFNVDELSTRVKTAKTSFYHFYKSREDFLSKLIIFWATQEWKRTAKSLEKATLIGTPEVFIAHKQSHIDFYCFLIRAFDHFSSESAEWKLIIETEEKLKKHFVCYFGALIKEENISSEIALVAFTYISGWDFLHGFEIYFNKGSGKKALRELSNFLNSQAPAFVTAMISSRR